MSANGHVRRLWRGYLRHDVFALFEAFSGFRRRGLVSFVSMLPSMGIVGAERRGFRRLIAVLLSFRVVASDPSCLVCRLRTSVLRGASQVFGRSSALCEQQMSLPPRLRSIPLSAVSNQRCRSVRPSQRTDQSSHRSGRI